MSDEVQMITESVSRFVRDSYPFEGRPDRMANSAFGANWPQFAELGWLGMPLSVDVDGFGLSQEDLVASLAEMGAGLIEEPFWDGILVAARLVDAVASEPQRQEILSQVIAGEWRLCLCHRESGSEFDLHGVQATAQQQGDNYVLNGHKRAISSANWASHLLLTATLDDQVELFLVPAEQAGVSMQGFTAMDGKPCSDVFLNDVQVAADARLSDQSGELPEQFRQVLFAAAASLCAEAAGIAKALREETAEYLQTRKQFGLALAKFQALQHRFADICMMESEILAAARMAARAVDDWSNLDSELQVRQAKARIGQLGRKVGEEAVQFHGGMGQTEELKIGHYLRRLLVIDAQLGRTQEHLIWIAQQD